MYIVWTQHVDNLKIKLYFRIFFYNHSTKKNIICTCQKKNIIWNNGKVSYHVSHTELLRKIRTIFNHIGTVQVNLLIPYIHTHVSYESAHQYKQTENWRVCNILQECISRRKKK